MSAAPDPPPSPSSTSSTSSTASTASTAGTAGTAGAAAPRRVRTQIPSTWSRPAEVVSTVPTRGKGSSSAGPIVGVVIAAATAALVYLALPGDVLPPAGDVAPAPATTSQAGTSIPLAIPRPPATSSTTPTGIAPEDQGGDVPAPGSAAVDPLAASDDDLPEEPGGITELPARKKAKALIARAISALRDGDASGAEPALVRAVLLDPSQPDAWRHLGIVRAQLGDPDGARRAYRKYLELAPKAKDAAQVRAILAAP